MILCREKKQAVHASGLVEVKATIGKTLDGKRIQKSFYGASKLEAQRKADNYKLEQTVADRTGDVFIKKDYTFAQWEQKWLEGKKGTVKESTYDTTYRAKIDKYLIPRFGSASLPAIRQIDVQAFFTANAALSRSTLNKLRIILHSIFDSAIDNDLCYKNPVKNIKMSNNKPKEKRVYSKSDRDKLEKYCFDNGEVAILLLCKTGLRRSELLGLRWDDVDFDNNLINIRRAVTSAKGGAVEGETKTKSSVRAIPIDVETALFLREHCNGGKYIAGDNDKYIDPSVYAQQYRRKMATICASLQIEPLNMHELRHTFGTLLRENKADIYTIQKVMGHSDIGTTAKIYVHNDIEVLRKAMKI